MMKKIATAFILLFGAITFSGQAGYADSKSDLQAEIGALLDESRQLKQEQTKIYQESVTLKNTLDGLKLKVVAIKQAETILDRQRRDLELEYAQLNRDIVALKAHPTCNGTYEPQEYARRKAWCDAEWAKIHQRAKILEQKKVEFNRQIGVVNQDKRVLSQATLDWTANVRKLDGRINKLAEDRTNWFKRFLNFRDRRALDQLKRMAGASQACANIPGIGQFERQLDGASERAHRCLQALWDGARRR